MRGLRARLGWTHGRLAAGARASQPYLCQVETGLRRTRSLALLARLTKRLGVPVADFLV